MKRITCPINGPRPASEFVTAGQWRQMPDPDTCTDDEWADYVFNRTGVAGVKREWWLHVPSGVWFIAERDTARDVFLRTWLPSRDAPGGPA
jgi:sarcosine oxidase subunit delta